MARGVPVIEFHTIGFVHYLRTDHEICFVRFIMDPIRTSAVLAAKAELSFAMRLLHRLPSA
jgi:hypothetical protein